MTYWEQHGKYQQLADKLNMIPMVGMSYCNPELELFRVTVIAYYDIYNGVKYYNGACNPHAFKQLKNYINSYINIRTLPFEINNELKEWLNFAAQEYQYRKFYLFNFDGNEKENRILELFEQFYDSVILYVSDSVKVEALVEKYVRNVKEKIDGYYNNQTVTLTWDENDFDSSMICEVFDLPEIQEILKNRNITIVWDVLEKRF
jgi:hypothetical protein